MNKGDERMTQKFEQEFKKQIRDRLEGRDIQRAVEELVEKAEDVCMDDVGMPLGFDSQNEDHQMMFFDIVAEQLREVYFSGNSIAYTIEDI